MTSAEPAGQPVEQAGSVSVPAARATPDQAAHAGGKPAAHADTEAHLRAEIEQTREQLGETVDLLAAKADVKSRARDKATELSGRVKGGTAAVYQRAVSAGRAGTSQLQARAATANQLPARVAAVSTTAREAAPERARQAVARGTGAARRPQVVLAVIACALLLATFLAVRQWQYGSRPARARPARARRARPPLRRGERRMILAIGARGGTMARPRPRNARKR